MFCSGLCWRDRDTDELFCPGRGWVEECPRKEREREEQEDDDGEND